MDDYRVDILDFYPVIPAFYHRHSRESGNPQSNRADDFRHSSKFPCERVCQTRCPYATISVIYSLLSASAHLRFCERGRLQ